MMVAPHYCSIAEMQAQLCDGKITALALTRLMLERIQSYNGCLNAFITVTPEEALTAAQRSDEERQGGQWRGHLHGIPIAIKDNIDTAGVRTTAGSMLFADRVPEEDAEIVRRLRLAGAIILGKTGTHELAYGTTSDNAFFGRIANPWDLSRDPGGSSGGSAVAVAAGLAFAAIGSDTACSIRYPAHCCGVVGFKPSLGLVSTEGVMPLVPSLDHVGPLTRSVADAALVTEVMAQLSPDDMTAARPTDGPKSLLAGLRIGVSRSFFFRGDCRVLEVVDRALHTLEAHGAKVVETGGAELEKSSEITALLFAEAYAQFADFLAARKSDFSPELQAKLMRKSNISARDYIGAQENRSTLTAVIDAMFEHCDILAAPTSTTLPARFDARPDDYDVLASRNATIFNLGGNPSISIPCGIIGGLPVGLMLSGPRNGDTSLLRQATAVETVLNVKDLFRPPLR
jgi:aspartyl-tRNA(Asn)/glutamyl-tRNA(Gln) amidotransferase subunit A